METPSTRDRLGILWSYYFRDLGFDTRSAVAFAVFGFDARDRASLRNKKREKAAPAARGALATRQRRSDIQGSNIFCPNAEASAFTANVYGKKAFIVAPSLQIY